MSLPRLISEQEALGLIFVPATRALIAFPTLFVAMVCLFILAVASQTPDEEELERRARELERRERERIQLQQVKNENAKMVRQKSIGAASANLYMPDNRECAICYEAGLELSALPCRHVFCTKYVG